MSKYMSIRIDKDKFIALATYLYEEHVGDLDVDIEVFIAALADSAYETVVTSKMEIA